MPKNVARDRLSNGAIATPARRWASITETAEHVGVSTRSIRQWIADGRLKAYRNGGEGSLIRLDLAEVDASFTPIA